MPSANSSTSHHSHLSVNTHVHRDRLYANSPSPLSSSVLPLHLYQHTQTPVNTPTVPTPLNHLGQDLSMPSTALLSLPKSPSEPGDAPTPTHAHFPSHDLSAPLILNRRVLKSLHGNPKSVLVLRKRLTTRLDGLRGRVWDANGDQRQFVVKSQDRSRGQFVVDCDSEEQCIDRHGFTEVVREQEWERGLFAMDTYCVMKEISELEKAIEELDSIVPGCR